MPLTSDSSRTASLRKGIGWCGFLLALSVAAYWGWQARHLEHLGYFHDDGMYFLGAKTLAESGEYRIPNLTDAPAQTKYPPGFAFLLSLAWLWQPDFPANLPWALFAAWILLPVNAWIMVRLLESWGCSRPRALLLSAWVAVNPYILFFSMNLMPELMLSVFIGAGLLIAQRAKGVADAVVVGVFGACAYLTKAAAMPFLLVAPLWFAWKRERRMAIGSAAAPLLALILWNMWLAQHGTPPRDIIDTYYFSYIADFLYDFRLSDIPAILWVNVLTFLASAGSILVPDPVEIPLIGANLPRLLTIFAIAGIVREARKSGLGPVHWFALGYSALVIVWVYSPHQRFLIPLAPLIVFGAQAELTHLFQLIRKSRQSGKRDQRVAGAVFRAFVSGGLLWAVAMVVIGNRVLLPSTLDRTTRQAESNLQAYAWIRANVPPDARLMADHDAAMFLYTGHSVSRPPSLSKLFYREDKDAVRNLMRTVPELARARGIGYWLVGETDFDDDTFVTDAVDLRELTASPPYRLVFEAPMARLYQIE